MTFMSQTIAEKTQPGQRQSIEESSKYLFFFFIFFFVLNKS